MVAAVLRMGRYPSYLRMSDCRSCALLHQTGERKKKGRKINNYSYGGGTSAPACCHLVSRVLDNEAGGHNPNRGVVLLPLEVIGLLLLFSLNGVQAKIFIDVVLTPKNCSPKKYFQVF